MKTVIVEDSELIQTHLLRLLGQQPRVEVVGVATEEEQAIALILASQADAVLLDLCLSPGSGVRVLERIREAGCGARVLVLTHNTGRALRLICEQLGVAGFYDKSTEIEACLTCLFSWLPLLPDNEPLRLQQLHSVQLLDTEAQEAFGNLTQLAAEITDAPIALISLVDENRQWFLSHTGTDAQETSRSIAFCAHTILQSGMMEIQDAHLDARFRDNPLVIGSPQIRFYGCDQPDCHAKARRQTVLLWAGCLIVSGALFAELLRERAEAERDAGQRVQGYARLLAEHTAGAIRNAELAAQGLAAHPEVQRTLAAARGETAGARPPEWPDLETFMRAIPGAIKLYVADHRGHVLASAVALPDETSIIDAQSLRELAHGKGTDSQVSGTLPDHASGRQAIQITHRVEDRKGRLLGIIGVSLGIEEGFSPLYRSVDFPAQATISLWDGERQRLMRHPMDAPGGRDPAIVRLLETLQADPILSVVTWPEDIYLEAWRSRVRTASAAALALLALCGMLTLGTRRQREAAAALSREHRLRAEQLEACGQIVDTAPIALALVDTELRCVIINTTFADLLGRDARTLAGQAVTALLPDKAWDALHQDIRAALDGSKRRRTLQIQRGTTQHRFEVEVTPFLRNWRPAGAVLSLRDVSVQRLAEEALMRREAELKAIFESGPECVKLIGLDGRIQRINPAGLALLEADDLEHGLATRLETLVDPADRAAFIDFNARVMKGEGGTLQYRGVGLKGTPPRVETHAVPMRDKQGVITGALAITRDISAIRETGALLPADGYTAAELAGKPSAVI